MADDVDEDKSPLSCSSHGWHLGWFPSYQHVYMECCGGHCLDMFAFGEGDEMMHACALYAEGNLDPHQHNHHLLEGECGLDLDCME